MRKHLGDTLDSFLKEEGVLEEVESRAAKRLIALQIADEIRRQKMTKSALARRMKTSRTELERVLNPKAASVSIATLERTAAALGKRLRITLVQPSPVRR